MKILAALFTCAIVTTALVRPALASRATMSLVRTDRHNRLGNPIYSLSGFVAGKQRLRVDAVSGTRFSQRRDRRTPNIFAPIPDGNYQIGAIEPGLDREVGKTFVRLRPRFKTRRSDLGIHWDVSYERRNGRDGTAGCVGTATKQDLDRVRVFVNKYHPQNLVVKILV
jgi:hypothetical protein